MEGFQSNQDILWKDLRVSKCPNLNLPLALVGVLDYKGLERIYTIMIWVDLLRSQDGFRVIDYVHCIGDNLRELSDYVIGLISYANERYESHLFES